MKADLWWRGMAGATRSAYCWGAGLVPPGAGSHGGQVVWGRCDGDRAVCAFFCRAAAAAADRGEADPGGAGGGGGRVPAVGQQPGAGRQPHRPQGHRGPAGRGAGPDWAGGRAVRGGGPRQHPASAGPGGRRRCEAAAGSGDRFSRTGGWPRSRSRTRRCSSAAKRPPARCWSGCRGCWRARGCWWCRGCRARGSRRFLRAGVLPRIRADGLAAAPGAASWPCVVFTPTRAPLDELALRVAVAGGGGRVRGAAGSGRPIRPGSRFTARQAALARPRGPVGDSDGLAPERDQPAPRAGCCWWSTSSRSCSPSAPMRASGGLSSLPCTRPPRPDTGRIRPRRHWSCWACVLTSRPGARTIRSWPTRSRTGTWSPR